jgi:hypothetical protein
MSKTGRINYIVNERISHNVNNEYEIVFDRCTPKIDGQKLNHEELLMRYTKNGKTVNNAPAFDETDMIKAIVKLYNSPVISEHAKKLLRDNIK